MEKLKIIKQVKNKEIEEYEDDIFNEIKSDYEFYNTLKQEYNFSDEEIRTNVAKFYNEYQGFLLNKKCKRYKDCLDNNAFYRSILIKDEYGNIEEASKEMDAFHEFMKYKNKFGIIDFDIDYFYNQTFKQIPREEPKKEIVQELNNGKKFIYIYGGQLTYKTSLSIAIVNSLAKKNSVQKIAFVNTSKRFKEIADNVFDKSTDKFNKMVDYLKNVDCLVLDGLGEEYRNELVRDMILIPILKERTRNSNKKFTIITSSYSLKELKQLYLLKDKSFILSNQIYELISSSITKEYNSGKLPIK